MVFKITEKTRIKIPYHIMWKIKVNEFGYWGSFYDWLKLFQNDTGLKQTCIRSDEDCIQIHFFKIEDKQKFLLAKIKYGI